MQAGGKRGTLPLIRRFNEHSEKLLHLALSVLHFFCDFTDPSLIDMISGEPNPKRRRLDESQSVLSSVSFTGYTTRPAYPLIPQDRHQRCTSISTLKIFTIPRPRLGLLWKCKIDNGTSRARLPLKIKMVMKGYEPIGHWLCNLLTSY